MFYKFDFLWKIQAHFALEVLAFSSSKYFNNEPRQLHSNFANPPKGAKAIATVQIYRIADMRLRAQRNGILISLESLTPGKQQRWLEQQPQPKTREEAHRVRRVKRLIRLAKDEENE